MIAAEILDSYNRGIPAIGHSTKVVDACAFFRGIDLPCVVVLGERGGVKGVLSQKDLVHASGRLGSSVMQMPAVDLARDRVPACAPDTQITDILQLMSETSSDFVLVVDGSVIKGCISLKDSMDLLLNMLAGDEADRADATGEEAATPGDTAAEDTPVAADLQPGGTTEPSGDTGEQQAADAGDVEPAAHWEPASQRAAPEVPTAQWPAPEDVDAGRSSNAPAGMAEAAEPVQPENVPPTPPKSNTAELLAEARAAAARLAAQVASSSQGRQGVAEDANQPASQDRAQR
jgi:CBS domain-containing protein